MVCRPAGDYKNTLGLLNFQVQFKAAFVKVCINRFPYRFGLLVNFLQHKMLAVALVGRITAFFKFIGCFLNSVQPEIVKHDFVFFKHGNFTVVHSVKRVDVFAYCRRVRGGKAALTQADNKRACLPHAVQLFGLVFADYGQRKRALQKPCRVCNCFKAVVRIKSVEQVHRNLCVGVALHCGQLQVLLFQHGVVFDNSVVHKREFSALMGVGVFVTRLAVCCPSRVSYADCSLKLCALLKLLYKCGNSAFFLPYFGFSSGQYRYAGRIIAPVFHSFQPVYKHGHSRLNAVAAYNSAH